MSRSNPAESTSPPPQQIHLLVATIGFFAFAVYGSLVPLQYRPIAWDEAIQRFRNVPYLDLGIGSRADWVSNILLFIPLGFLSLGTLAMDRRRDLLSIFQAALVVACCLLASIGIEFTQLWFPPRTVSQNDIIAEAMGGVVGAVLWLVVGQTFVDWLRQYTAWQQRKRQLDWLLEVYFLGFLLYHVLPLDLTISLTELWQKLRSGRVTLIPFADLKLNYLGFYGMFRDVVTCVPLGALASLWRIPSRRVRSWSRAFFVGSLIVIGVEFLQLFVFSRFSSSTDVLFGMTGVALGIALTRRLMGDHSTLADEIRSEATTQHAVSSVLIPLIVGIVYSFVLVAIFCAPFDFTRETAHIRQAYEGFLSVPFARIYGGSEFNAISSSLANLMLFAPLGCITVVAATAISGQKAKQRIVLMILWLLILALAFGIELLQMFLPSHFADVTEVIIRGLGSALGIVLTYRLVRRN